MKTFLLTLGILGGISLSAQQTAPSLKGATPVESSANNQHTATTRAVVVGISDYQDPGISDLRFAGKDAEAFANFLRSPAGGSLDNDHIKVLLNSAATMAQFANALDWLIENTRENDRAIIYFSGHGDVEKKTLTQPGFLLCWDAPSRVYMGGGAFALQMLQEVVSTLSVQNKANVLVIADACRSGTLAGNNIGGAQATAANLAKQYASEIKILSCQPTEYSIEGEQWGGGRGAFSFNLVDALYGLADSNNDLFVTLMEVRRYLEDHVTAEVAPVSQVPMVSGNLTERMANVDASLLSALRSNKTSQMAMLSNVESRGVEEDVLAEVDTKVRELYRLFKKALKNKNFLEPAGACADIYYERLAREPKMERLHSTMRRNYAAALQDDAQQELNIMLKTGLTKQVLSNVNDLVQYKDYPAYLERAALLLGSGHYLYASLQARKHFFLGCLRTKMEEKKVQFLQALTWQPDMPHAFNALIGTYPLTQTDSATYYAQKAMEISPNWVVPYTKLASFYESAKQPGKADSILDQALQVDSNSIYVWYHKAFFYNDRGNFEKAEYWYKKVLAGSGEGICFLCAHLNLGTIYGFTRRYAEAEQQYKIVIAGSGEGTCFPCAHNNLGMVYNAVRHYDKAEQHFIKAIQLDSTFNYAFCGLGRICLKTGREKEALQFFEKAMALDSTNSSCYSGMALYYLKTGNYAEAERFSLKAQQLYTSDAYAKYVLACLNSLQNQLDMALEQLEKALMYAFEGDYESFQQDEYLTPLQTLPEWKALMKKHFPGTVRD